MTLKHNTNIDESATTQDNPERIDPAISDADYALETTSFASASVLQQAGVAVLAQANQQPQEILKLLPR